MTAPDAPAWGDAEPADDLAAAAPEDEEYSIPGEIDLGGGFKLVMSPDAFRQIMHSPEITAKVDARCKEITDTANSMAVAQGAEYIYFVSNNPDNIRARGRVKTHNRQAIADNLENSTLLKALASVGSDPHPYFGATPNTEPEEEAEPAAIEPDAEEESPE